MNLIFFTETNKKYRLFSQVNNEYSNASGRELKEVLKLKIKDLEDEEKKLYSTSTLRGTLMIFV